MSQRLLTPGGLVTGLLLIGLLASLFLTARALEGGSDLGDSLFLLLLVDLLALLVLGAAILTNLARLLTARRREATGARLTTRLLAMFVTLALVPAGILFAFSLQFIQRGVDSWFHVEVERALDEALGMARYYLDRRSRELLLEGQRVAAQLEEAGPPAPPQVVLPGLRRENGLDELALFGANGTLLGSSGAEPTARLPRAPARQELLQVAGGQPVSLVVPEEGPAPWRVVAYVPVALPGGQARILRVADRVPAEVAQRSEAIHTAAETYRRLQHERGPLKTSFLLTLTLVLVLTVFVAVWLSFRLADRFTAPIRALARGTRAVARGEYGRQLPVPSHDELGVLVRSFNAMTRRLAAAQEEVRTSHAEAQARRVYLETILDSLSAGVVTLSAEGGVDTINPAAREILGLAEANCTGRPFGGVAREYPHVQPLFDLYLRVRAALQRDVTEQLEVADPRRGGVTLLVRGTPLRDRDRETIGYALVFDDITELLQAQRASAWGEVARRLAHEIKNPLTPIQLSAERLRRKYLPLLGGREGEALDRATATIIQQVEGLRDMVNAFSEYARQPGTRAEPGDLSELVGHTVALYREETGGARVETVLAPDLPPALLDPSRMTQVLGNLIQNALMAVEDLGEAGRIRLRTGCAGGYCGNVFVEVEDNGPGFPPDLLDRIFDPYVTTKPHGSGLGLAIVRKIVEEHGGRIAAENAPDGGARVRVELPVTAGAEAAAFRDGDRDHG